MSVTALRFAEYCSLAGCRQPDRNRCTAATSTRSRSVLFTHISQLRDHNTSADVEEFVLSNTRPNIAIVAILTTNLDCGPLSDKSYEYRSTHARLYELLIRAQDHLKKERERCEPQDKGGADVTKEFVPLVDSSFIDTCTDEGCKTSRCKASKW